MEDQIKLSDVAPSLPPMPSKVRLAMEMSKLKVFDQPDVQAEQYPMDGDTGAEVLWDANFKGDIEGRRIADLGCGTGILGIGALLLGAGHVCFVDNDDKALAILKENLTSHPFVQETISVHHKDVNDFTENVDVVIQNPPFGTRQKHADKEFLKKAFELAPVIYTFHKATSKDFIAKISEDHGYAISQYYEFDFPIKMAHLFHKRKIHRVKVGCWRLERKQRVIPKAL